MGSVATTKPLPILPEEVTAEWLTEVLGHKVASVTRTQDRLNDTMAKFFLGLTWEDEAAAAELGLPKSIMVKGLFNPERVNAIPGGFLLKLGVCEAMWYKEVAPKLKAPVEVAKCWWSGADEKNGIVILEDLGVRGCTFGDTVVDYPVEWVRHALEQLAGIHATTWGTKAEDITWADMETYSTALGNFLELWDQFAIGPNRPPLPERFRERAWVEKRLRKFWRNVDPKTRALLHNDPHASNTYMTPSGAPRFLDWQCVAVGSALNDVAYCIGSAMAVENRRAHELGLIDYYLERLAEFGGPKLAREEVMDNYRCGFLMGWGWILTPYAWHSEERVTEMSKRYVAAMEDHQSMELVESTPDYE